MNLSGASTERSLRSDGKFTNLRRRDPSVSSTSTSDGSPSRDETAVSVSPNNSNNDDDEASQTKLVEAEIAEDVDVEALLNERLQQMAVGVAATVQREDQEEGEEEEALVDSKNQYLPLIALMGVVAIAGAVIAGVLFSQPTEAAITTAATSRLEKVLPIVENLAPLNPKALIWITEKDIWEPDDEDASGDYMWLERYVMAELYYTTNGTDWNNNENWLSAEPVCNWYFHENATNECPGPIEDLNLGKFSTACGADVQLLSKHPINQWL